MKLFWCVGTRMEYQSPWKYLKPSLAVNKPNFKCWFWLWWNIGIDLQAEAS